MIGGGGCMFKAIFVTGWQYISNGFMNVLNDFFSAALILVSAAMKSDILFYGSVSRHISKYRYWCEHSTTPIIGIKRLSYRHNYINPKSTLFNMFDIIHSFH
ncbi:hypothetical protein AYI70_g12450 [Smittium culicis]|uniref:Uncharacterized protein n=1 Tax=Smittium culicis TaxID=133412 RepID=A0A1R1WXG6_9FUNG|nr:hypothetical protein AYI70_g12450 [Smittium culicis]